MFLMHILVDHSRVKLIPFDDEEGSDFINASYIPVKHPQHAGRGSSVGSASAWFTDGRGFDPHVRQHSFVEFGHEIISTAILSFPLIQEGQLSVTGEKNVH